MRYFEVEGNSPAEVLAQFLKQKDIPNEYVSYEILEEGSKGILGLGKRKAKVKLSYNEVEHIKRKARMIVSDILEKMKMSEYHIATSIGKDNNIVINIEMNNPELLIGKMAQTLDSFQYLLDKILKLDSNSSVKVTLDVDEYRKKNVEQYIQKAISMANQVKSSGKSIKMPPMITMIRKEIHIALKEINGISTFSIGDGAVKQICIASERNSRERR